MTCDLVIESPWFGQWLLTVVRWPIRGVPVSAVVVFRPFVPRFRRIFGDSGGVYEVVT